MKNEKTNIITFIYDLIKKKKRVKIKLINKLNTYIAGQPISYFLSN